MVFKCLLKVNLLSRNNPKCSWRVVCGTTFSLKNKGGWLVVCTLCEKISSCGCLVGSGLKFIFHWNAHSPVFLSRYLTLEKKPNVLIISLLISAHWLQIIVNFLLNFQLFLDISKAFDKVLHQCVLFKLKQNGKSGNLLKIMEDFLANWYQRVNWNGKVSRWAKANAGVPQSSIFGTLLFLIYINDLVTALSSNPRLFVCSSYYLISQCFE